MKMFHSGFLAAALLLGLAGPLAAQEPAEPQVEETGGRSPRLSWTADRREFGVGDVITVLIDEYALASANKSDVAQDLRRRDLDLVGGGTVGDATLPSIGGRVGSTNDTDSRQLGDAVRQNRFQTEMTVRVVGLEQGGLLRVEGRKMMKLDDGEQELRLSGIVRPQDISTGNLVDSWRVADAELIYTSSGMKPRGGILGRILGAIWP